MISSLQTYTIRFLSTQWVRLTALPPSRASNLGMRDASVKGLNLNSWDQLLVFLNLELKTTVAEITGLAISNSRTFCVKKVYDFPENRHKLCKCSIGLRKELFAICVLAQWMYLTLVNSFFILAIVQWFLHVFTTPPFKYWSFPSNSASYITVKFRNVWKHALNFDVARSDTHSRNAVRVLTRRRKSYFYI